jgi:hypothetical protein
MPPVVTKLKKKLPNRLGKKSGAVQHSSTMLTQQAQLMAEKTADVLRSITQ